MAKITLKNPNSLSSFQKKVLESETLSNFDKNNKN